MTKKLNLANDVKTFLEEIEEREDKPLYEMTPEEARDFLLSVQRKNYVNIDAEVTDKTISSSKAEKIDIRTIKPKTKTGKLPAIIYAHGGGWVMGDKEAYDMLIKRLANESECCVIFADYKKSPEHTYPSALNEICGVLEYVTKYPDEFNIDINKIALAGDSAGGNLAAACALKTNYEGGPKIKALALLYPVTDASMNTKSYEEFKNGPWLSKKSMEFFWESYVPDKKRREETYASLLNASTDELKNLPQTLILTVENDVLRDEGEAYADRLMQAGVPVIAVRYKGTIHDFMMLDGVADTCPAKAAVAQMIDVLKETFSVS